jgi:hypothetical protein
VEQQICSSRSCCTRHNFSNIRGWMQMVIGTKWFIFLKQIIQWDTILVMVILHNCCTMHKSTHSVHNRLLKPWRVHLLHQWPCCYVPSPPLSGANCWPFPLSGGPGPPVSKMAPFSPGSTHTPFPLSVTHVIQMNRKKTNKKMLFLINFMIMIIPTVSPAF